MKEKFRKVLRVFRVDVLLFGLFHKIALAVTKKLKAFKDAVHRFLTRLFPRNGEKACAVDSVTETMVETSADTLVDVTVDTLVDVTLTAPNA